MNTGIMSPSRDKYYAMILMRMNAREYTLVNYGYAILKVVIGFLPFSIWFGMMRGVPLWFNLLLPLSIAGIKMITAACMLWDYERNDHLFNENNIHKNLWLFAGIILALAYGLPAVGIALPSAVTMAVMIAFIPAGAIAVRKIIRFPYYREINQLLLAQMLNQMDAAKQVAKTASEKTISADRSITSKRKGFEYLNELFIKRHQKILWKSTKKIVAICCFLIFGGSSARHVSEAGNKRSSK